ncbi:MAG: PaaI family thioesterase [Pseudomonadota bacterium]
MSEIEKKRAPIARDGWLLQSHLETFSGHAGPYLFRKDPAQSGVGFFAEPHHANLNGVVHGGALLTLADMALWDICRREIGIFRGATVTLNAEFVGPGAVGQFIEASGEMVRAGGRLLFARGLVTSGGETLLSFSGALKRLREKSA